MSDELEWQRIREELSALKYIVWDALQRFVLRLLGRAQ